MKNEALASWARPKAQNKGISSKAIREELLPMREDRGGK
jgi:hypothetical protein